MKKNSRLLALVLAAAMALSLLAGPRGKRPLPVRMSRSSPGSC